MKKAIIISCFDWYEKRLYRLYERLRSEGYEVLLLNSDFDHIRKERITEQNNPGKYLRVPGYKKNVSAARIASHFIFALKTYKEVLRMRPSVVYALVPPNSVCHFINKYKKKAPETVLIYDLIDLWPESFPSATLRKLPVYGVWKNLRDKGLDLADIIVTECSYYLKEIGEEHSKKSRVLRLYKSSSPEEMNKIDSMLRNYSSQVNKKEIKICYLGSINNIIDIDSITTVANAFVKRDYRVCFNIIGDGSAREQLISALEDAGCVVEYHGLVFDDNRKRDILSNCDFGINMMKESVKVGLTLKSIDYLLYGLPLINNIKGDTWEYVEKKRVGFNFDGNVEHLVDEVTRSNVSSMKINAHKCYLQEFSKEKFESDYDSIIDSIMKKDNQTC